MIIVYILAGLALFLAGAFVDTLCILKTYKAGEYIINTTNPNKESVRFEFSKNPINDVRKWHFVLFVVRDEDVEKTSSIVDE